MSDVVVVLGAGQIGQAVAKAASLGDMKGFIHAAGVSSSEAIGTATCGFEREWMRPRTRLR